MFSKSPVKSVVEKINPVSKRGRITSLKFERKADYRTFLRYVKNNTKDLEKLSEKSDDKVDKKGSGLLGGLILLALFGGGAGGSGQKDEGGIDKLSLLNKAIFKAKADDKRFKSQGEKKTRLKSIIGSSRGIKKLIDFLTQKPKIKLRKLNFAKVRNFAKNLKPIVVKEKKVSKSVETQVENNKKKIQRDLQAEARRNNQRTTTTTEVSGDTTNTKKSSTATLDKNQGKQGPTGGTGNRKQFFKSGSGDKLTNQDLKKLQIDQGAEQQIKDAKKIDLKSKLEIKSDIRLDRKEKPQRALKVLDDLEAESKRRKIIEDVEIKRNKFLKFNRRVDRLTKILFPFASFISNPKNYLKFQLVKDMIKVEPFADGTLTGVMDIKGRLPGDEGYDESTKGQYVKPVNIFIPSFEGNQSTIPFDTSLDFKPLVSVPKDLQSPSNNIIVDYEFSSSDDLFFMKMAGN